MKYQNVVLQKNLRKTILQGNPWLYSHSIDESKLKHNTELVRLVDNKHDFIAWAMYCPDSPLRLRIVSLDKKPPNAEYFANRIAQARKLRSISLDREQTNAYRLINGEGDLLPGLVCDVYNHVAVIQFDGDNPTTFWQAEWVAESLLQYEEIQTVFWKPRRNDDFNASIYGKELTNPVVEIKENGVRFLVDLEKGQKTGFFLDQRNNRDFIRSLSKNKSVLNLFSYTGGFSIYAGLGGASKVVSVDIAQKALEHAHESWVLNGLDPERHTYEAEDVLNYNKVRSEKYDIVISDPPSMAHSGKNKQVAIKKYVEAFVVAAKLVKPGGILALSSCSSHINFEDFYEIVNLTLSKARRTGQIIRISGQGEDHPFPHALPAMRYLKFFCLQLD